MSWTRFGRWATRLVEDEGDELNLPDHTLGVLLVDDSADERYLMRLLVERHGGTVVAEAANGEAGVVAAGEHHPDLVLLDLAMPTMSGVEALPALGAAAPSARIVVLSQFPATRVAAPIVRQGAAGFVQKGASAEQLWSEILLAAGFVDAISHAIEQAATSLEPIPRSAGEARRFVDQTLRHWDCRPLLDTVVLLVSELVSNVVQHARTELDVAVWLLRDRVRVEVSDRAQTPVTPRYAGVDDVSGRGLMLVERMSQAWGVDENASGKTVWFEVERPVARASV